MASLMICPHCKAAHRIPPGYTVEAIHCNQCDKPFRARTLAPTLRDVNCLEPDEVAGQQLQSSTPLLDSMAEPALLPVDTADPTAEVLELQCADHHPSPVETPEAARPLVLELLESDGAAAESVVNEEPILLDELPVAELVASPPPMECQLLVEFPPKSLLDSLDLSLPAQPYLSPIEPDARSVLDTRDLMLRSDVVEAEPVLLEEYAGILPPAIGPDAPVSLTITDSPVDRLEHTAPVVAELVEELAAPAKSTPEAAFTSDRNRVQERSERPRPGHGRGRRIDRRREINSTRRSAEWLANNKVAIIIGGVLLVTIVMAILLVNLLDNRKPSRSIFAAERRKQQEDAQFWQPAEPPVFQQPMMPVPPGRDPRFDPAADDPRRPFAQPPVFNPKQPNVPEPKKQRPKSKLPQEKRDPVTLADTALIIDAAVAAPSIDSKPVELAAKGTTYNYLLEVRTRSSGAKALLELGPPGMKLQSDARLIWEVPSDYSEKDADVTLRIIQSDGRECTQSFVISIR